MNVKFIIAGIAIFLISLIGGIVFHGILLHNDYGQIPNLMRTDTEAMGYLPFMMASHLTKGFAFVWIYKKGLEPGIPALTQGLKFGVATVFLVTVPLYLVYYSVQPMPGMLVVKQILSDSFVMVLAGVVVSMIIKPPANA